MKTKFFVNMFSQKLDLKKENTIQIIQRTLTNKHMNNSAYIQVKKIMNDIWKQVYFREKPQNNDALHTKQVGIPKQHKVMM